MPKISLFKSIREVNYPIDYELIDYLEKTRDGEWQDIVLECRLIKDKEKRNLFKQSMPTATLSGQFESRNDAGLVLHSEYIAMDLDEVENVERAKKWLIEDKYVYSVFVSTSGTGLRVIFKIKENEHRRAFKGIAQYLYETYNLISDPNGINVSKPYCVSYDPYLYINPDVVPVFTRYIKEKIVKPLNNFFHTDQDFNDVLKQIIGRGVNIAESYNDYIRVGFAISQKFGESGRDYFHQICSQSPKYNQKRTDYQYTACLKDKGTEKVNISTFYYLAKINNISITSEHTKKIVRTTKNGKKAGLKKEQIVENLAKFENITGIEEIVSDIYDSRDAKDDEEESILHGLEMFLSNNYSLRMNEVTGYLEQDKKSQYESDLNTIFIAAKKVIPTLDFKLMMRLLKSDFIPSYHPFFDFFGSDGIAVHLPPTPEDDNKIWDSPVIDTLSSCIVNDNPAYTLFFTRKWIISIISAMHKVHSPLLHCLLGPQGTGKTEFYRRLLPNELKMYFQQSKLDRGKDDELLMCENILIMDDELSGKTHADKIKLNSVTSSDYFSLRRPYGDHNEKVLRYAVLCGTSNYPQGVLSDPTGNRRIIPIDVKDINKELLNSINRKDLFFEAYTIYKQGFDWRVGMKDVPYLNTNKEKYEAVVKERELIYKFYIPEDETRMSTTEILVELELLTKQRLSLVTLGRELSRLGFEQISTRTGPYATSKKWCVGKIYKDGIPRKFDDIEETPF